MGRIAKFVVTVDIDDTIIINPGHLMGGMVDEVLSWNEQAHGHKIAVSTIEIEDEVDAVRREAMELIGLQLDFLEGIAHFTGNEYDTQIEPKAHAAATRYAKLRKMDVLRAYVALQAEVVRARRDQ